jgi:serine protease Do
MEEGISMGVISSAVRQIESSDPMVYIQTDANINEGNSGGPIVDIDGNIIGISNFKASQAIKEPGFGLAAPSNIARPVYEQIRDTGRVSRGIIGVATQTINPLLAASLKLPQDGGVLVVDVLPTSSADLAGIRAGDIIHSLDGRVMENSLQFNFNIYQHKVDDEVNMEILRAGERKTVRTLVFERPDVKNRLAQLMDKARTHVTQLVILAAAIDEEVLDALSLFRDSRGVLVAALLPGSLSGDSAKPGDLIHAVGTVAIKNLTELNSELGKRGKGDIVYLYIERQMQYRYVLVELQ